MIALTEEKGDRWHTRRFGLEDGDLHHRVILIGDMTRQIASKVFQDDKDLGFRCVGVNHLVKDCRVITS